MNDLPGYLGLITIIEVVAIAVATCVVLYLGAIHAHLSRRQAVRLAVGAAVVFGGWYTISAVIAAHGGYHTRLGRGVPWLPVAFLGFLGVLLVLARIPAARRALAAPGMTGRLLAPHWFRVGGLVFVTAMVLGRLPALFALPAGLGDIAVGIGAAVLGRRLALGEGRRGIVWLHISGMTDLLVALTLGGLTAYHLVNVTPPGDLISEFPLALIPTAAVPLLFALHITSLRTPLETLPTAARTESTVSPLSTR
jgi:hypothetical protein